MSLAHHFLTMAHNNAWANHRLLSACSRLTDEEFRARRTSFFPSILATLNHNVTVDHYYVDALTRGLGNEPVNPDVAGFFTPEHPYASAAELRPAQRAVDLRLIALCRAVREDQLENPVGIMRRQGVAYETATRMLAHLFEHQIHHRGQAHAMLAGTRIAPPQLDEFFCASDAEARAADFTELGFSEAELWGPEGLP